MENTESMNAEQKEPINPPQLKVVEGGAPATEAPEFTYMLDRIMIIPIMKKLKNGRKVGESSLPQGQMVQLFEDPDAPEGLTWGVALEKVITELVAKATEGQQ